MHVLLKCSGLKPPGIVNSLELVSTAGRSLRFIQVPLPSDRGAGGLWNIPDLRTPSQSFFLKMTGKDGDGYDFQRLSSVSYTNINPGTISSSLIVSPSLCFSFLPRFSLLFSYFIFSCCALEPIYFGFLMFVS